MRPDGTITREYVIQRTDCKLVVKEVIEPWKPRVCRVHTVVDDTTAVAIRLVLTRDGTVLFGPQEEYRRPGFTGDWLPWDFSLEDFIALLRLRA
jgi:hypothetical protein